MKIRQNDSGLASLLEAWLEAREEDRAAIEAKTFEVFEEPLAILVIDMSGFSETVVKHGIIHFLGTIHRMRQIATPLSPWHGGEVVKYIADDILAVFDDVDSAYRAADAIFKRVYEENDDVESNEETDENLVLESPSGHQQRITESAPDVILDEPGWYELHLQGAEAERMLILKTLEQTGHNKDEAARRLGIDVKTVRNKLKLWRRES